MENLAYLFECHFTDGSIIFQTQEDVSTVDPTRSAFYDVVQKLDAVEVFGLVNDQNTYAVDLRDGHFELNGVPFEVHSGTQLPPDCVFRLIYFRRCRHTVTMGYSEMQDHSVEFHFGW